MLGVIRGLRSTSTVVLSSHVLNDVERVCDRVAIIDQGRLVTESAVPALLDRFAQPVYRLEPEAGAVDRLPPLAEALRAEPWVASAELEAGSLRVTVTDDPEAGQRLLARVVEQQIPLAALERVRPTLEDVFLRLTGRRAREQGS